ncbi:hypothetical protein ACRAWG_12255 [Methylobacterium sp. P31]
MATMRPANQTLNCEAKRLLVCGLSGIAVWHVSTQLGELGTKIEIMHGLTPWRRESQGTAMQLTKG